MTAVETRSAALSRSLARQCVNQRTSGIAQRPHERGGEDGVDRAHVRDDRASPEPRELARERGLEARAAQRPVPGAERAHAAVVGQHARDGAVGEHDDLVDERRERADLRHRRRERRVPRIDLLRDEDELRH